MSVKIEQLSIATNNSVLPYEENHTDKRDVLVYLLRYASKDRDIIDQTVLIPDGCEKYGFIEGNYEVSNMIHFLADMLEE